MVPACGNYVVVHPTGQLDQIISEGGGAGLGVVTPVGLEGLQGSLACEDFWILSSSEYREVEKS